MVIIFLSPRIDLGLEQDKTLDIKTQGYVPPVGMIESVRLHSENMSLPLSFSERETGMHQSLFLINLQQ